MVSGGRVDPYEKVILPKEVMFPRIIHPVGAFNRCTTAVSVSYPYFKIEKSERFLMYDRYLDIRKCFFVTNWS